MVVSFLTSLAGTGKDRQRSLAGVPAQQLVLGSAFASVNTLQYR